MSGSGAGKPGGSLFDMSTPKISNSDRPRTAFVEIKDPEFHKALIDSGVTVKELCRTFTVPIPTAERWLTGESAPHELMQGYVLDYLKERK